MLWLSSRGTPCKSVKSRNSILSEYVSITLFNQLYETDNTYWVIACSWNAPKDISDHDKEEFSKAAATFLEGDNERSQAPQPTQQSQLGNLTSTNHAKKLELDFLATLILMIYCQIHQVSLTMNQD